MDEGLKTGFLRVDKDLEALDQRINRRQEECDKAREELRASEGKIEVLEERSRTQREMIEALMAWVENMEGQLCHCGKGKGRDVEEGRVSLLDSPIALGRDIDEGSSSDCQDFANLSCHFPVSNPRPLDYAQPSALYRPFRHEPVLNHRPFPSAFSASSDTSDDLPLLPPLPQDRQAIKTRHSRAPSRGSSA